MVILCQLEICPLLIYALCTRIMPIVFAKTIFNYLYKKDFCVLQATKHLTVSNVRTMKMNDDVLVVAVSPDAKYIAVALLDCTVKV